MKEKSSTRFLKKAACLLASASMVATMVVAVPARPASAAQGDTLSIGSAAELASFRDAVNAGNAYEGTTVRLSHDLTLSGAWTPIGTVEHPFRGTFDGRDHSIAGLQVSGTSELGFFGCVGVGGKVENLVITNGDDGSDPSTVTATSGTRVVRNVGSIAGYAFGTPGGNAIENCRSAATVTVSSTMKSSGASSGQFTPEGAAAEGTTGTLEGGWTDGGVTIENIGGVVGYSASGISGTSYSGALSATTHEDPNGDVGVYVGSTVGGIAGQVGGYSTTQEIESSQRALTVAHYPKADGSYAQTAESAQTVSDCSNSGTLQVVADGNGGKDRFNQNMSAAFEDVGGIVGNSFASVQDCTNTCDIVARSSAATGGIAGTLRGSTYTGSSSVLNDAGEQFSYAKDGASYVYTKTSEGPELVLGRCTNRASVTGLAQVGGILGEGGTHTRVEYCKNVSNGQKGQAVTGTRWNKPMPAGIAGMTHGDVTHCYNRVDVVTETGGGYYTSGLVGMLGRYTADAGNAGDSPVPQMEACYSTGTIQASGSYRQSGICGQNEGTIHDCYMLEGSVINLVSSGSADSYAPMVATNDGTVAETVGEVSADDMQAKAFCGQVNAPTTLAEYRADEGFLPDIAGDAALNDGYPVFGYERTAAETDADRAAKEQLKYSGLSAQGTGSATYRADGNPVPTLSVGYNGTGLVQGADFYVIPDDAAVKSDGGCRDISEIGETTFNAHIVGIGDYYTEDTQAGSLFTAPYKVGKGEFSSCSAAIVSRQFDYLPHYPAKSDITVTDAAGNVVPGDQYSIPADPGDWVNYHMTYASQSHDGKAHVGYELKISAGSDANYTGELYGYFQITKAELFRNEKTHFSGFGFGGQTWNWSGSRVVNAKAVGGYLYQTDSAGNQVQGMKIVYTGEEIKPTALALQYEDGNGQLRTLVEGTDYRVIYGDPGRDDLISRDAENANTDVASGTDGEVGTRPCVTVRYVPGDSHNFSNYQNFFFDIVAADLSDSSQVTVTANEALDADSVVVKGRTGATISADNYTVERYSANGKTALVVTGKKNLTGSLTLGDGAAVENGAEADGSAVKGDSSGSSDKSSTTVKVTKSGVTYKATGAKTATASAVSKSAKSVKIPATVRVGGKKLKVTAVAAKACKGSKKLKKLTIGTNVKTIGAQAFSGCAKLSKLTIGKNVTSIGKQAFKGCGKLAKLTLPSKVKTIGKQAFYGCKKLKTVTVKTTRLGKKSIGSKAFAKIAAKAKVKVPKKKLSAYKKYLKKAGLPKKAVVRK